MTHFSAAQVRQAAGGISATAAGSRLAQETKSFGTSFDIFLSHSFRDAELIFGLKRMLEADGLRIYVDWIDDPKLDRTRVNADTAIRLRQRMKNCRSLVYATSRNASTSRWMPWELGLFDGMYGAERVAICPVAAGSEASYVGQEYLDVYKTVENVRDSQNIIRPYAVRPDGKEAEHLQSFVDGRGLYTRLTHS